MTEITELNISYRNPVFSNAASTQIDVELNHPDFGWIPFTAREDDAGDPHAIGPWIFVDAIEAGGIAPYSIPVVTDEERRAAMPNVSARQLRLTLVRNGLSLASIDQAIASLPSGQAKDEALIEWEYAHEFQRVSPTLNTIATALSIIPSQVDEMWSQATAI